MSVHSAAAYPTQPINIFPSQDSSGQSNRQLVSSSPTGFEGVNSVDLRRQLDQAREIGDRITMMKIERELSNREHAVNGHDALTTVLQPLVAQSQQIAQVVEGNNSLSYQIDANIRQVQEQQNQIEPRIEDMGVRIENLNRGYEEVAQEQARIDEGLKRSQRLIAENKKLIEQRKCLPRCLKAYRMRACIVLSGLGCGYAMGVVGGYYLKKSAFSFLAPYAVPAGGTIGTIIGLAIAYFNVSSQGECQCCCHCGHKKQDDYNRMQ